jgi:hopanoid biosynthesis associated membrane protein HpnM
LNGDGGWGATGGSRGEGGYAVAREFLTVRKPPSLSFRDAAEFPMCFLSAFAGLYGAIQAGDTVYIPGGGGGVGHLAVQMAARALGAGLVISSGSTPQSIALARHSGAHHVFDYKRDDIGAEIAKLTSGRGGDLVFDATYNEVGFVQTAKAVRRVACQRPMRPRYWSTRRLFPQRSVRRPLYGWLVKGRRLGRHFDHAPSERVACAETRLPHARNRGGNTAAHCPSVMRASTITMALWKAVAFAAGVGLSMLSYPVHAAPSSGGDTVQGLYEALVSTMKNGRTLGPSGRFAELQPVIRRSFDIAAMARLSVGLAWAKLSEGQRTQLTDSFGRYISATYADRFDSYAGQKLEVTGEQPAPSGVMVKSQITKASGELVKVDYMMRRNGDSWLISDIYLDGAISEVSTRRSEFAAILKTEGIDGLVAALNRKADILTISAAKPF